MSARTASKTAPTDLKIQTIDLMSAHAPARLGACDLEKTVVGRASSNGRTCFSTETVLSINSEKISTKNKKKKIPNGPIFPSMISSRKIKKPINGASPCSRINLHSWPPSESRNHQLLKQQPLSHLQPSLSL